MKTQNLTVPNEFIFMGITDLPEPQAPLFGLFLIIYVTSAVDNLGMVIFTKVDSRLQTPMYFFLRHLALTDLGYATAVGTKMLANFIMGQNSTSFYLCTTQLAFFIMFIISELFILAAMSYDHFVAICKPLLYTVIMSQRVCWILMAIPYLYSASVSLTIKVNIFNLSFCGYNIIKHFYCDCLHLISLLCSNTQKIELIILIFSGANTILSLPVILFFFF